MSLTVIQEKRKEISDNILKSYKNTDQLTTKQLSVEEFQKAFPEESFDIITDDVMKGYGLDTIDKINKEKNKEVKDTMIKKAGEEIASYDEVIVKAEKISKIFYVRKKKVQE